MCTSGSTAAMRSAGGKPMHYASRRMQFMDREPIYHDHMPPPSSGHGFYEAEETMTFYALEPGHRALLERMMRDDDEHDETYLADGRTSEDEAARSRTRAHPPHEWTLGDAMAPDHLCGQLHAVDGERDGTPARSHEALGLQAPDHLGDRRPAHLEAIGDAGLDDIEVVLGQLEDGLAVLLERRVVFGCLVNHDRKCRPL